GIAAGSSAREGRAPRRSEAAGRRASNNRFAASGGNAKAAKTAKHAELRCGRRLASPAACEDERTAANTSLRSPAQSQRDSVARVETGLRHHACFGFERAFGMHRRGEQRAEEEEPQ